jgi:hypothetical protein
VSETIYFVVHGTRLREDRPRGGGDFEIDLSDLGAPPKAR